MLFKKVTFLINKTLRVGLNPTFLGSQQQQLSLPLSLPLLPVPSRRRRVHNRLFSAIKTKKKPHKNNSHFNHSGPSSSFVHRNYLQNNKEVLLNSIKFY